MSRPPKCKLCKSEHWFRDPHVLPKQIVSRETLQPDHNVSIPPLTYDWQARERELGLPVND